MKTTTQKILDSIRENEKRYDLDIMYFVHPEDLDDCDDVQDIQDYLEWLNNDCDITNEDVIYYSEAIKYLAEHDQSLSESLSIASDMWYETSWLSSEILASLLKSKNNVDELNNLIGDIIADIEDIFE